MEKIMELLSNFQSDLILKADDELIESGILTSVEVLELIGRIEEEFEIQINPLDIDIDNFRTANTIWCMIQRYL